jgi:hypothetical protein
MVTMRLEFKGLCLLQKAIVTFEEVGRSVAWSEAFNTISNDVVNLKFRS